MKQTLQNLHDTIRFNKNRKHLEPAQDLHIKEPLKAVMEPAAATPRATTIHFSYYLYEAAQPMSLPEAIVYLLASAGYGMKTDQIAREINERRLYVRRDGKPVSDKQVYAVIMAHPDTFVKADGRIRLMI